MAKEILDLLGHHFKVNPRFKFSLGFPDDTEETQWTFNSDRYTGEIWDIGHLLISNKWIGVIHSRYLGLYIVYQLELIRYEEEWDDRFGWKYPNRYKKVPKTRRLHSIS